MRYLTLHEVLELHDMLIEQSGGAAGLRDLGGLESAIAQPEMTFGGQDLYPTIETKANALCFSLVKNHPFIDGNKRIGHAALETFLVLNSHELNAPVDEAEAIILRLAAGELQRDELLLWISSRIQNIGLQ